MTEDDFFEADVTFNVGGKPVAFKIICRLPATQGLNIDGALDNWLARTSEYTAQSFVAYINSKWPEPMAWTQEEWAALSET